MGLNKNIGNEENVTYLSVIGGNISQKVAAGTPGAVMRVNKKGAEVHEMIHNNGITGIVVGLVVEESDYGQQLKVTIKDVDEKFFLFFSVESKFFDSFASKIGSADLSKEITIRPFSFVPKDGDGSKISGVTLTQGEVKLDYYFTEEDAKGKPFIKKGTPKLTESKWKMFKLAEREFLCEYINELIQEEAPAETSKSEKVESVETEEDSSDLPWE